MAGNRAQVRLCCEHVANAVYPHHNNRALRDQLTLALEGLAMAAIAELERRLAAIEKDSHPPVDVLGVVQDAVARNQLRLD